MLTNGEIITIATFVITVGALVWKTALISAKVDSNAESVKKAHSRIDEIKKDYGGRMDAIMQQLSSIRDVQIRLEERLSNFIALFERSTYGHGHMRKSDMGGTDG